MVGLNAFGEAAWACEQIFNTQLADQRAAEPALLDFARWVLGYLGQWVEDIAASTTPARDEREVKAAAERLGRGAPLSSGAAADISLPIGLPPGLPSRADLDLRSTTVVPRATSPRRPRTCRSSSISRASIAPAEPGAPTSPSAAAAGDGRRRRRCSIPSTTRATRGMQTTLANEQFDAMPSAGGRSRSRRGVEARRRADRGPDADARAGRDSVAGDRARPRRRRADAGRRGRPISELVDLDVGADAPLAAAPADRRARQGRRPAAHRHPAVQHLPERGRRAVAPPRHRGRRVGDGAAPRRSARCRSRSPIRSPAARPRSASPTSRTSPACSSTRSRARRSSATAPTEEARLFVDAAEEIRRLLHQFAAGFLQQPVARPARAPGRARAQLGAPPRGGDGGIGARRGQGQRIAGRARHGGRAAADARRGTDAVDRAPVAEVPAPRRWPTGAAPLRSPTRDDSAADAGERGRTDEPARQRTERAADEPPAPAPERPRPPPPPDAVAPVEAADRARAPTLPSRGGAAEVEPPMRGRAVDVRRPRHVGALGVAELKPLAARRRTSPAAPVVARASTFGDVDDEIDAVDAVDLELFPIFEEEAQELLPKLDGQLRDWLREPAATDARARPACARCTRSRAAPAWPARCAWARWRTGSRPGSSG